MCAELRESINQSRYPLDINANSNKSWTYAYGGCLIEKYLSGQIGIAFCRAESASRDTVQRGFILRMRVVHDPLDHVDLRDVNLRWNWLNDKDSLVFPQIVEVSDVDKNVIPTVVSLCSFDRQSFVNGNPMFGFQFLDSVIKVSGLCSDGEAGRAIRYYAVASDNCGHHEIKASSNGIDDCANISDDERIKRFFEIGDEQFPIRSLRIRLHDDFVWATTIPVDETLLQGRDLGLGPLDWD